MIIEFYLSLPHTGMFDLTGGKCDPATTLVSIVCITVVHIRLIYVASSAIPGNTGGYRRKLWPSWFLRLKALSNVQ
jgi:hypothetical protein